MIFHKSWKPWMLVGIGALIASTAWADSPIRWKGTPGWEPESAYCRLYDTQTVVTVQGTIQRVEKIIPMKGMGYGVHFILKTSTETLPVHLGPVWYVEKQALHLRVDNQVEVTGSRVLCDGKAILLAATVKRDKEVATYRGPNGIPAWAGWRHH